MLTITDLELRAGPRVLMQQVTYQVAPGDRIGLVGRNGAGKTTMLKVLAGDALPAGGTVARKGEIGYLPQDPRSVDLEQLARDRILSARGLDDIITRMRECEGAMASADDETRDDAMHRYGKLEERFQSLGGYAVESEAATITSSLGLPDRALTQPLGTLSGGQRRRVELARILFSGAQTLLLDEPTNHLDADSVGWLRDFLRAHKGGLMVVSHDVELLDTVVNRVLHLDANRAEVDIYNVGWKTYLGQRESDERRRKRERTNAEAKATQLKSQADKMRAKATKAKAAQGMDRRAERLLAGLEKVRAHDKTVRVRFPDPAPCGKTPLFAKELSKSYGSLEIFTDVDLAIDRGSRVVILGLNGAGKTTLLRLLAGIEPSDTGEVIPGHGLRLGYYAQEHETIDPERTVLEHMRSAAPETQEPALRKILGAFLFSGDTVHQPAGTLSGGEKTRLALAGLVTSAANVLLLDEPTNNLDPISRAEVLKAISTYTGAIVLVTHAEGAVDALQPEKVILLPDGIEDTWSADLGDLVALA
ncbi:MAG: ABC-F family ATP-binding cassette domain-containing protein [Mycobacteriales bacterium]